jgi:hypothetical protein
MMYILFGCIATYTLHGSSHRDYAALPVEVIQGSHNIPRPCAARGNPASQLKPIPTVVIMYIFMIHWFRQIVVTKAARSRNEVEAYAECTLLAALLTTPHSCEMNSEKFQKDSVLKLCIKYLMDNEFITQQTGNLRRVTSWQCLLTVLNSTTTPLLIYFGIAIHSSSCR